MTFNPIEVKTLRKGLLALLCLLSILAAVTYAQEKQEMDQGFSIEILGDVQTQRTEAEVYLGDSKEGPWAIVYDTANGWAVEFLREPNKAPLPELAEAALNSAKESLSHYVNRRGENPPAGLTQAGFSLWLMEKDDGTAMGRPIVDQ